MKVEYEVLAVRALDSEGLNRLALKLDNQGFQSLTRLEQRTTIRTLKKWRRYIRGDVDTAIEAFRNEVRGKRQCPTCDGHYSTRESCPDCGGSGLI